MPKPVELFKLVKQPTGTKFQCERYGCEKLWETEQQARDCEIEHDKARDERDIALASKIYEAARKFVSAYAEFENYPSGYGEDLAALYDAMELDD